MLLLRERKAQQLASVGTHKNTRRKMATPRPKTHSRNAEHNSPHASKPRARLEFAKPPIFGDGVTRDAYRTNLEGLPRDSTARSLATFLREMIEFWKNNNERESERKKTPKTEINIAKRQRVGVCVNAPFFLVVVL